MPELYPQQAAVVAELQLREKRILHASTGTGKTPMGIKAMESAGVRRALIVCPAIVRSHWLKQLDLWWPGHPEAAAVTLGSGREKGLSKPAMARKEAMYAAPIQVVSYELLKHIRRDGWDALLFDEGHYLQSARSQWSGEAVDLVRHNPDALRLELTATLMPTEPKQVWNLLRTMYPNKWGEPTSGGDPAWWFVSRYCNIEKTIYGQRPYGVREDTREELAEKLAAVSCRLTRHDLGDLLPPFDCSPLVIDRAYKKDDLHVALDFLENAHRSDAKHLAVFCYYRETARELATWLQQKLHTEVRVIDGAESAIRRDRLLAELRASERSILVATMSSVGIGIDGLTYLDEYLSIEWVTSPGQMLQFLGRFSRLGMSGKSSAVGKFLVREGTEQENAAHSLAKRIADINTLSRSGGAEEQLQSLFTLEMTDEKFQRELAALVDSFVDTELIGDLDDDG